MHTPRLHPSISEQERRPSVTPPSAKPGEEVAIEMEQLPPATPIYIGFGALGGNHQLLTQTTTDDSGNLAHPVQVPTWATPDLKHFFFLAFYDQRPFATSHEFHVADPGGFFRVEGRITDEGFGCTAMRDSEERLYSLSGDTDGLTPGTDVVVRASLSDDPLCRQGIPIEVREIRTR